MCVLMTFVVVVFVYCRSSWCSNAGPIDNSSFIMENETITKQYTPKGSINVDYFLSNEIDPSETNTHS